MIQSFLSCMLLIYYLQGDVFKVHGYLLLLVNQLAYGLLGPLGTCPRQLPNYLFDLGFLTLDFYLSHA
jgi:hypothetical protein